MIKRIKVPAQGDQPKGRTDIGHARDLMLQVFQLLAQAKPGTDGDHVAFLIQNELAAARFQGYRQAMRDVQASVPRLFELPQGWTTAANPCPICQGEGLLACRGHISGPIY